MSGTFLSAIALVCACNRAGQDVAALRWIGRSGGRFQIRGGSILLTSSKGLLDPPMLPWPGPNAGCNILRRCAPPETRDSDQLLRLLHKSRSDVKPLLLLRGFAFQNGGDVSLHRGGGERRG